jgi:glycosyltransferase involved in cell wall biosynthesis
MRTRVLLIAEAANPDWVSVPLVGWSLAKALGELADAHLVTQVRNRDAILRAGLREGTDFTAIDSELLARPLNRLSRFLRGRSGLGWTLDTAISALGYYYFESLVWRRFGAAIRAGAYDVVHRVTPLSPTVPSLLAARCERAGVPFVLGPLNGGVPWPPGFNAVRLREREWLSYVRGAYRLLPGYRSTLRSSRAVIAGSRATLGDIPAAFHRKAIYLPENAIDPQRFEADAFAYEAPLRACFVGRLVPYKGPDLLLEAVAPLVRQGKLRLDVFGDGPLMPELRAQVDREGLHSGVTLHGWVAHAELPERMRRSQLFLFPSVREFGGGVVLEAMALGLVPVVLDYAGPGELVAPGTGFKIPLGSRADVVLYLRNLVERLCDSPAALAPLSRAARERACTLFSWRAKAFQVLQVYDWVCGRRGDKPAFFEAPA